MIELPLERGIPLAGPFQKGRSRKLLAPVSPTKNPPRGTSPSRSPSPEPPGRNYIGTTTARRTGRNPPPRQRSPSPPAKKTHPLHKDYRAAEARKKK